MNSTILRRLPLLLLLLLPCWSLRAQSNPPTKSEVESFISSNRQILSVGNIPDDFHRSVKEWYALSRLEGWNFNDPRLRYRNNPAMMESYQLITLLQSGELSYGDILSRWTQSVADHLISGRPNGLPPLRCYYLRTQAETPLLLFSQGVIIVTPKLFESESESQAVDIIGNALDSLGYPVNPSSAISTDYYPLLQQISRRSCAEWSINDEVDTISHPLGTVVINDTTPLVLINPHYEVCRNNGEIKMKKSLCRQNSLDKDIQMAAEASGCRIADYSSTALQDHSDSQFYNDYCLLSLWAKSHHPQQWLQDSLANIMERLGAHQYLITQVDNQEGVMPTMLWSAAAIGVIYSPALVALGTHLFSHSERFTLSSTISDFHQYAPIEFSEEYSLHDEHGYLRSCEYEALSQRMGRINKNPGFLGSHLIVAAGPSLGVPGLASLLGSGISHGYAQKVFEAKPSLCLEYAISPNWSIASDIDVSQAQLFVRSDRTDAPYYGTWNKGVIHTYGLTARYYRHQCEAPLGGYLGGGLVVSNVIFSFNPDYDLNQELTRNKLKDFYSLRLVWGRNYIFSRHFLFNYSLTFDYPFISALKPFISDNPNSPIFRQDVEFTSTIASDIWYQNTFVAGIKIGFLP